MPLFSQPSVGFEEYFLASNNSRQFSDNLNWIHGRHTMTFGFLYLRKGEEDFDNVRYVAYGCAPSPRRILRRRSAAIHGDNQGVGGDAFAEVELGLPSVIHQRFSYTAGGPFAPEPNVVVPYYGGYFNDKMKVTAEPDALFRTPLRSTDSYLCHQQPVLCALPAVHAILSPYPESPPAFRSTMPRHPSTTSLPDSAWRGRFAPSSSFARDTVSTTTPARARYRMLLAGALYGGVPGGFVGNEIDNSTPQEASQVVRYFKPSPQVALGTYPVPTGPGAGLLRSWGLSDGELRRPETVVSHALHPPLPARCPAGDRPQFCDHSLLPRSDGQKRLVLG